MAFYFLLVLYYVSSIFTTASSSSLNDESYAVSTIASGQSHGIIFTRVASLPNGDLVISDVQHHTLWILSPTAPGFKLLAGEIGVFGHKDGPAGEATFHRPEALAVDGEGNIYIADVLNFVIRMYVNATGEIKTVAGTEGRAGWHDGFGKQAVFSNYISDLTYVAEDCSLIVTDKSTARLRKVVVRENCSTKRIQRGKPMNDDISRF